MLMLKATVDAELARVNAFIDAEIARLPGLIRPVAAHAFEGGGKRLRPLLTLLFARALGLSKDVDPYPLACSLEFLHTATLLHDDILDSADLRRGKPAAHVRFGVTETVLAGDALLALANKLVAGYGRPVLTTVLAEAIIRTASGEIDEIASLRDPNLTRARYMEIITGKTAYLFQAACEAGALLAGAPEQAVSLAAAYGLNLGIAFQLVDDAIDYEADEATMGKPRGGDLREGKYTLPLLMYADSLDPAERAKLMTALSGGAEAADGYLAGVARAVMDGGFTARTKQEAQGLLDAAARALESLPRGRERDVLYEALGFVLKRKK